MRLQSFIYRNFELFEFQKKATIVKFFTCQGQMGSYNILDWVNFDIYRAWKELSEQLISKFFKLKDGKN